MLNHTRAPDAFCEVAIPAQRLIAVRQSLRNKMLVKWEAERGFHLCAQGATMFRAVVIDMIKRKNKWVSLAAAGAGKSVSLEDRMLYRIVSALIASSHFIHAGLTQRFGRCGRAAISALPTLTALGLTVSRITIHIDSAWLAACSRNEGQSTASDTHARIQPPRAHSSLIARVACALLFAIFFFGLHSVGLSYNISLPNQFINGQVIDATLVMGNYNAIVNVINGGIDHTNVNTAVGFWTSDIIPPTTSAATAGGTIPWVFPNSLTLSNQSASSPLCTDANKTLSTSCSSAQYVSSVAATAPLASTGGYTPTLSLTGVVPLANGGTNSTGYTNATCIRYNGTSLVSAAGDCVTGVGAGTNMTVTGSATLPTLATSNTPSFNTVQANTAYTYTTAAGCGGGTTATMQSANSAGAQNVNQTGLLIKCGTQNLAAADASGNWGFGGNVTAANFFNGSSLAYKTDWRPFAHFSALDVIAHEQFGTYRYKARYGDPRELNVGFIAERSPAWVAGPRHNREDLKAQANIDAVAIQELLAKVRKLESRVATLERHAHR